MAKPKDVLLLIKELSEKTGEHCDHAGFGAMSEKIDSDNISQRYLYDLYRKAKDLYQKGINTTKAREFFLDKIAQHLGYTGFLQFSLNINKAISDSLKSCVGNWWSYVRASSSEKIYKAPVRIFNDARDGSIRMELKGRERIFFGEIIEKAGCLFIYLVSGAEKQMGLVFKLGATTTINLLQGTYSGMSSAGYPIAGREILVREHSLEYHSMSWNELALSSEQLDDRLRTYFFDSNKNSIAIKVITGFDISSL